MRCQPKGQQAQAFPAPASPRASKHRLFSHCQPKGQQHKPSRLVKLNCKPKSIRVQGEKSIWISGSLSGSQQHGRSTRYSPLIRTRRLRVIDGHQRVGNSDRWVDALPQSPLDPQCDVRRRASNAVEHQRPIAPVLWHGFQLRGVQLFTNARSFAPLASPPEALPEARIRRSSRTTLNYRHDSASLGG